PIKMVVELFRNAISNFGFGLKIGLFGVAGCDLGGNCAPPIGYFIKIFDWELAFIIPFPAWFYTLLMFCWLIVSVLISLPRVIHFFARLFIKILNMIHLESLDPVVETLETIATMPAEMLKTIIMDMPWGWVIIIARSLFLAFLVLFSVQAGWGIAFFTAGLMLMLDYLVLGENMGMIIGFIFAVIGLLMGALSGLAAKITTSVTPPPGTPGGGEIQIIEIIKIYLKNTYSSIYQFIAKIINMR
ncbi:MAG: hypothetical protein QXP04_03310, partial [Candidatus Nanoarchaeia archaeon]|nr:hypothetical protein [Candidatus Jingweiarchaeum tengchongense]